MNTLYQGDNLQALRSLPDASVDLIATDPPFNTGKDWGAFNDKWEGGLKGYLKFMEPRLIECRRVLKDTGSLYLHCDPTACHYLKVMLDTVFGIKQFRNEIVWHYANKLRQKAYRKFTQLTDIIYWYSKSQCYTFNPQYEELSKPKKYAKITWVNGKKVNVKDKNGETVYITSEKRLTGNLWCFGLLTNGKERLGYPTQKPVALYQRMIKASSNQGDTVLDPFAGSGTTLDAAHTLGRQWIGIDVGETAIETIQERMRTRHGLEYDRDYQLIKEYDGEKE